MSIRITLLLLLILSCKSFIKSDSETFYWQKEGNIFGTNFNIVIEIRDNSVNTSYLEDEIYKIFYKIDHAFSLYKEDSKISKLNRNESIEFDETEIKLFELSQEICLKSHAYFFPYKKSILKNLSKYISIEETNYEQICNLFRIQKEQNLYYIKKRFSFIEFDFNAIAKGYTVDLIKVLFETNHLYSYLIEIGGEICVGNSPKKYPKGWMIGLESYHSNPIHKKIDQILFLKNICLASSGNYYEQHIFNPYYNNGSNKTKRVTVFGPSCSISDAYATLIFASNKKFLYSQEYFINVSEE